MGKFILYNKETGKITGSIKGNVISAGNHGMVQVKGDYHSKTHFVNLDNSKITEESICPLKNMDIFFNKKEISPNGKDVCFIGGIPKNALCKYEGKEFQIDDGVIEFSATSPGDYSFEFSCVGYHPSHFSVRAIA